ncbi:hypothetical protein OH77DRAFT_1555008 [Trametes cingulata]|nr:hypothetical protein OH77DRAFT_1555008 [Trametes cingulata]
MGQHSHPGRRLLHSAGEQEGLILLLNINGLGALTLLDIGSTTELLSNDFARVSECDLIKLENPATLQLGCVGSRSCTNFGTRAPTMLAQFGSDVYFDIVNLDRYDAVLGTPFLRRFGVILDFENNCVHIDSHAYPALSRAQVSDVLSKRSATVLDDHVQAGGIYQEFADLFQPVPPGLPPLREVNHTIPLIDPNKQYNYHLPQCPEVLQTQLSEKIDCYVKNGWWEPRAASQAAPLLCVYKKDGRLRTVVDLQQRNDNTVRDVTPFPDQDQIRNDVARARYLLGLCGLGNSGVPDSESD